MVNRSLFALWSSPSIDWCIDSAFTMTMTTYDNHHHMAVDQCTREHAMTSRSAGMSTHFLVIHLARHMLPLRIPSHEDLKKRRRLIAAAEENSEGRLCQRNLGALEPLGTSVRMCAHCDPMNSGNSDWLFPENLALK